MCRTMMFITHIVVLILISVIVVDVKAGCLGDVGRCNWEPWKPWSECSRTCGGGTRKRYRQYCCKSSLASNRSACLANCGHDLDYYYQLNSATEACNTWCFNDGYINSYNSCTCSDTVYGTCCENQCEQIDNCKRRRCTSPWDNRCLECYHEKTFAKNDTKCEDGKKERANGNEGVLIAGIISGSLICIAIGIIGLFYFRRHGQQCKGPMTKTSEQEDRREQIHDNIVMRHSPSMDTTSVNNSLKPQTDEAASDSKQVSYMKLAPENLEVNIYSQIHDQSIKEEKENSYINLEA